VGSETAASAGQTAEQKLALAHQALLNTRGIQFDFKSIPPQPPMPEWVKALGEILRVIGPALAYVFWGGLILGALFIVYVILREVFPNLGPKRRTRVEMTDWRPASLASHDNWRNELSDAGRFEPLRAASLLVGAGDLRRVLCGHTPTWLVGSSGAVTGAGWLADPRFEPVTHNARATVWHFAGNGEGAHAANDHCTGLALPAEGGEDSWK